MTLKRVPRSRKAKETFIGEIAGVQSSLHKRSNMRMSSQSIFAFNLFFSQPADPRQRPPAVRHRNCHHNFICAGSIADPHLHAIKMAADKRGILMAERNVEHHSKPAALLGGRN